MIYTLTINPSLDYVIETDMLENGKINRARNTYILPGGKGINVSSVLTSLGVENTAILPVAGFTGNRLLELLSEKGIQYENIMLGKGETRINVKVLAKEETQLNGDGPDMTEAEMAELFSKFDKFSKDDILVLSGSVPKNLGDGFYKEIMEKVKEKGVRIVLDTSGDNFLNGIKEEPFLVKPNREELESLFQTQRCNESKLQALAKKVQDMGAKNVLVSLGENGAMLLAQTGEFYKVAAPEGNVVNTVGAGDSMVAGFLAGYLEGKDMKHALEMGVAAGSASAFSKNLATKEEIDALFKNL